MPTIKTKKEMNLPELIEWGFKNDIKNVVYNSKNGLSVNFSFDGKAVIGYAFSKVDTFTVEVEEEITEDTVFDKLISRYVSLSSKSCYAHSINTCIKGVIEDREAATHIYIENEDNELQLIWTKEKGLV